MHTFRPSPFTLTAAAAIGEGFGVKCTASEACNVTGDGEGTLLLGITTDAVASGSPVAILDRKTPGLVQLRAHAGIAAAAPIYCAAAGRFDDAASGEIVGIAVTAATNQDDLFWAFLFGASTD
ncbi:MAG TPA: capsid cement protein [Phycisphaerales bacterium]|nr:capsid cement protein [Phycisphaerales bacterium]